MLFVVKVLLVAAAVGSIVFKRIRGEPLTGQIPVLLGAISVLFIPAPELRGGIDLGWTWVTALRVVLALACAQLTGRIVLESLRKEYSLPRWYALCLMIALLISPWEPGFEIIVVLVLSVWGMITFWKPRTRT